MDPKKIKLHILTARILGGDGRAAVLPEGPQLGNGQYSLVWYLLLDYFSPRSKNKNYCLLKVFSKSWQSFWCSGKHYLSVPQLFISMRICENTNSVVCTMGDGMGKFGCLAGNLLPVIISPSPWKESGQTSQCLRCVCSPLCGKNPGCSSKILPWKKDFHVFIFLFVISVILRTLGKKATVNLFRQLCLHFAVFFDTELETVCVLNEDLSCAAGYRHLTGFSLMPPQCFGHFTHENMKAGNFLRHSVVRFICFN